MADESKITKDLSEEQRKVLLEGATEAPFSGKLLHNEENGVYTCAACDNELFKSNAKFESTLPGLIGWPSFNDIAQQGKVKLVEDNSIGMHRTEVICANCGCHLGHLFDDKASETGQHYCINSLSLDFKPDEKKN